MTGKKIIENYFSSHKSLFVVCWLFFSTSLFVLFLLIKPESSMAMEQGSVVNITEKLRDSPQLKNMWRSSMNVVNSLVILVLLVVSFAEMLRINVNTYGVKKTIPSLVMAVIAANFSYILSIGIVGSANVFTTFFKFNIGLFYNGVNDWFTLLTAGIIGGLLIGGFAMGAIFIGILIILIPAILVLILYALLFIRVWMIYFLVIVAPFGIMAMVLPQTKSLFTKWWSTFIKWTYLPIPAFMFLWLGSEFLRLLSPGPFSWLLTVGCLFASITVPFKMGGGPMSEWAKFTGLTSLGSWAKKKGEASLDRRKTEVKNAFFSGNARGPMRLVGGIGRRMELSGQRFELATQLPKMQEENRKAKVFRQAAHDAYMARDEAYWSQLENRAEAGRLKKIMRGGVSDEHGSVSYKNSTVPELGNDVLYNTNNDIASARDLYTGNLNAASRRTVTRKRDTQGKLLAEIFEEHAASYSEIVSRSKSQSRSDYRAAADYLTNNGIDPGLDLATMSAVSAVGKKRTASPNNDIRDLYSVVGDSADQLLHQAVMGSSGEIENLVRQHSATSSLDGATQLAVSQALRRIQTDVGNIIDQQVLGINFIFNKLQKDLTNNPQAGALHHLQEVQTIYNSGLTALNSGNFTEASRVAREITHQDVGTDQAELLRYYEQISRGIHHFTREQSRLGSEQFLPRQTWEEYKKTIENSQREAAIMEHRTRGAFQTIQAGPLGQSSVQQIMGDNSALDSIKEHLEDISRSIRQQGDKQGSSFSRDDVKNMLAATAGGAQGLAQSLSQVLRDDNNIRLLARRISEGVSQKTERPSLGSSPHTNTHTTTLAAPKTDHPQS
ncbi:MAG TPA: hypothetical protein PK263_04795 [bacterium]|nr:hypothetical protein [bacterium]